MFDGHGGPGAALKASKELHQIVHEGLEDVAEYLVQCKDDSCDTDKNNSSGEQSKVY